MKKVSMKKLIKDFGLVNLSTKVDLKGKKITKSAVNRLALQLTGFFEYFDNDRIQVLGKVEYAYLRDLDPARRDKAIEDIFMHNIPCLVICYGMEPYPEIIKYSEKYDTPVLQTKESTTDFTGELIRWLKDKLAQQITLHGVLLDIYGEGVLIMGESGIGKSETALELIKRGHRLVSDDAVEIRKLSDHALKGRAPELIKYFIELRGIGVVNVKELFGVSSIKEEQKIDLVIKLEMWDDSKEYDRLGLNEEYIEILGNKVVCSVIPVRPGRNTAVICELAAINHRQKKLGYNAAEVLNSRVFNSINISDEDDDE